MIHIDINKLKLRNEWHEIAKQLLGELKAQPAGERSRFIEKHREQTWGDPDLLKAMRSVVGNKCWYSEVALEGADPNVDHFRPKGSIQEVDQKLKKTAVRSCGYWWLAFEPRNFRLASMHSNQRRVDEDTEGGKWDFFPIRGHRTPEGTVWDAIVEDSLALDPCCLSDVSLLWYTPDGKPGYSSAAKKRNTRDEERVNATIWLYHLDKHEIVIARSKYIEEIQDDLRKANGDFVLWDPDGMAPNLQAKRSFDCKIAEIKKKIADDAIFAGSRRCAVRLAVVDYPWIETYGVI